MHGMTLRLRACRAGFCGAASAEKSILFYSMTLRHGGQEVARALVGRVGGVACRLAELQNRRFSAT